MQGAAATISRAHATTRRHMRAESVSARVFLFVAAAPDDKRQRRKRRVLAANRLGKLPVERREFADRLAGVVVVDVDVVAVAVAAAAVATSKGGDNRLMQYSAYTIVLVRRLFYTPLAPRSPCCSGGDGRSGDSDGDDDDDDNAGCEDAAAPPPPSSRLDGNGKRARASLD